MNERLIIDELRKAVADCEGAAYNGGPALGEDPVEWTHAWAEVMRRVALGEPYVPGMDAVVHKELYP